MTLETIKSKIAALLAKAESTDNAHEQDAFMAKVNELLERHQIEMHEIRVLQGRDNDPMCHDITGDMTRAHEWPTQVGFALARFYGARMIRYSYRHTKARYKWQIVGRLSACTTFDLMFPFVQSQVRQQARRFAKEYGLTVAKAERSVGIALSDRIWSLVSAADARRQENSRNALVPVDDVKAYLEEQFGELAKVKNPDAPIYAGARDYAEKVSLNQQADAATRKRIA